MAAPSSSVESAGRDLATLQSIEQRILWLATRMIDYANRERPSADKLKVGGHQASSASMVTMMTALYFDWLRAGDRVAVKPHASPVLHAINYLLGRLDREYLTTLRDFGGCSPTRRGRRIPIRSTSPRARSDSAPQRRSSRRSWTATRRRTSMCRPAVGSSP